MKIIEVKELTKKYKEHTAVDGISFEVEEGEMFAFLGENGAGKSTTINMLTTILQKTAGTAFICGHELGREDDEIRKVNGIVFQNSVLDKKLTVKENLLTRGSYYGLSRKEVMKRLEPFSESFEMKDIWDRKYEKLSGGQRRRVDIMRALINNPKILFLDEPTTGLDPKSRKLVWDYINYLRREYGMTIFLTTHYMEETRDADHVVILDKGRIVTNGTPAELKTRYAHSRLVWYTAKSANAEALITRISRNFVYDADHYSIETDDNLTEFIFENREEIRDYELIKGTMDDVFLNLTGKELA
ncbi:ABC transporter ATP-binding protein [Butyrivibrio sp. AE2032]|uniref:ABC transporter ATP-binding protein n=1 Tax=Butyrivibrio sp. AE2032 TaxID=1458463 RepID=UPI000555B84F|nr:ABC transporter ATP-binding protein [Butyrivibrio sp. AE2032]